MLNAARVRSFMLAATVAPFAFSSIIACQAKQAAPAAQSTPAAQPAAGAATAAIPLQPYTAPDQSASAGVPAGWKVVSGAQGLITMSGPQGEAVQLGTVLVANNAPFQAGKSPGNGVMLSMPSTTPLAQKLATIIVQNAALNGKAQPQVTITSSTPIQVPAALGQCGRFVASINGAAGAMDLLAAFCSMPMDPGGTYKNVMLLAQAPVATAAQSAPTARAIFQSYRVPSAWLQKMLAPFQTAKAAQPGKTGQPLTNAQAAAETQEILRETAQMQAATTNSANCFDLSVLRETPTRLLPKSCGGMAP
jgi:hypothetical protein